MILLYSRNSKISNYNCNIYFLFNLEHAKFMLYTTYAQRINPIEIKDIGNETPGIDLLGYAPPLFGLSPSEMIKEILVR